MNYHNTEVIILRDTPQIFGDGYHETTQMILEALYQQNPQGKTVLDIGTGTGIQSIFAKKWGAAETQAVDIDLQSILTARKNFKKNNVEVISQLNIYNELLDFKADITIANLPIHNIKEFIQIAKQTMASQGILIFSWPKQFNIYSELDLNGFEIVDRLEGIDWDAYIVRVEE